MAKVDCVFNEPKIAHIWAPNTWPRKKTPWGTGNESPAPWEYDKQNIEPFPPWTKPSKPYPLYPNPFVPNTDPKISEEIAKKILDEIEKENKKAEKPLDIDKPNKRKIEFDE